MVQPVDQAGRLSRRKLLQSAAFGLATAAFALPRWAEAAGAPSPSAVGPGVVVYQGVLTDVSAITVHLNDGGVPLSVSLSSTTSFWRGMEVGLASLRAGDKIMVQIGAGGALRIWANLLRVRGTISGGSGGVYVVRGGNGYDTPSDLGLEVAPDCVLRGSATTHGSDQPPINDWSANLTPGIYVDAIGLIDGGVLHATRLDYFDPQAPVPPPPCGCGSSLDRSACGAANAYRSSQHL